MGVDFSHAFNKSTTFSNKFLMEAGSSNTLFHDDIKTYVWIVIGLLFIYLVARQIARGPGSES